MKKLFIFLFVFLPLPIYSQTLSVSHFDRYFQVYSQQYLPELSWKYSKAQCYQESLLNPVAISPVGAKGLCQFMPRTWEDMQERLGFRGSPFNPIKNIRAQSYYMRQLIQIWSSRRPYFEKALLATASYNAGAGNIIQAQRACGNALLWKDIAPCLVQVTGHFSKETLTYVERIQRYYGELQ